MVNAKKSSLFFMLTQAHHGAMVIIHCPTCDAQHLVANDHIMSKHRTSDGVVGYVRCAAGHTLIHQFTEAYPKPKPPASVIALRQQLATNAGATKTAAPARRTA